MENIDFTKIISEEDMQHSINDNLKGIIVLIDGMIYADEYGGSHRNQKESYNALTLLSTVIDKVNNAAESVDYMHGKLVEFNKEKV